VPPKPTPTLVIFTHYPERLSYFADWLDALKAEPAIEVIPANLANPVGHHRVRRHARSADLVIVLHSAIGDSLSEIARCEDALSSRRGPLVAFIGNEISLPNQPLRAKVEALRRLQPQIVGTQLLVESAQRLYADVPSAKVVAMPHALNPATFQPHVPQPDRPVDIGFRGARYLASVGDDDRNRIVDYFASASFAPPLVTDIRTDTSYGRRGWSGFLSRCKATIGAESGAHAIRLEASPGPADAGVLWRARLRPGHRYLPRPVKNALRRSANRLAKAGGHTNGVDAGAGSTAPDLGVSGKCISSRHFEAIGTETCQILFPGRYNDLLEPDRHYLRLEPDFSNIDEVLAKFRDESFRLRLVRGAREWALDAHTYAHRVRTLLDAVGSG
jgi:Glycosyl transferases group 1